MDLLTPVHIASSDFPKLTHNSRLMSLGSCFSEHIGQYMVDAKLKCLVNPYGVLYNPLSIAKAIQEMLVKNCYKETDLFYYNELWNSWMHHGSFSDESLAKTLDGINKSLQEASHELKNLDVLFLTFGTAWVYRKLDGTVVSNCHKVPGKEFSRTKLSVDDITATYKELLRSLMELNPKLKIVFSISPIRHVRDGLVENQRSKATLVLAIDDLCDSFKGTCFYFPSYEIVLDELRDYRFYDRDMVHPSSVAVEYIWEKFRTTFCDEKTKALIDSCLKIKQSLNHRPINPNADMYVKFLDHLVHKIEQLIKINPTLDYTKELERCHTILKKLKK